ncbi:MAG TPA: bifunctional [glutamine synthetase] adenylyltransferase/[glutamine synthetase]-adenylyl-L-tyrosine phosphorylase [Methylovirgula sp.]|nr:bifunctional [glutamine synthetase] adenylyltransferase/[glutamine synthetase]-adenylyl-L-tyrosine phosphorylase [Methylovirgula sp.]
MALASFLDKQGAPLRLRISKAPVVADQARAQERLQSVLEADGAPDALADPAVAPLLLGVADHSPYLWQLIASDPQRLARLLTASPEASLSTCLETLSAMAAQSVSEAEVMQLLRRAKQETALLIALADICGAWTTETVMTALTEAADVFVQTALRFALSAAARAGQLICEKADNPEYACGVVILALGKHGSGELNYSSDTDLIVLFDHDCPAAPPHEAASFFIKLTRRLVKLLQERTVDGYVLRVDLRLRPDPGSTAIAIAAPAAFAYYEIYGQNWERAAMIKARVVAGDRQLGAEFLNRLRPFIWRKYLDYASIADIHAMKRQIHVVKGHGEVAVAGHDVKLGRGGIREIEFFVQTQQLVYGGRQPDLRGRRTLDMLAELQRDNLISLDARDDLTAAYLVLREIEHRLQMIADEQTQRLPADEGDLRRFANFCGFADEPSFAVFLSDRLNLVADHYGQLFEEAPGLSSDIGNLVFTGVSDDPETLATLERMGFRRPSLAAETIRGWHFGRRAAMRSERAREVLTELVPALLQAFGQSGDPDGALFAFDSALERMKAASELLAILKANAPLRDIFANLLGGAPRLAEMVVRRPHILDAVFDRQRLATGFDLAALKEKLAAQISAQAATTEDFLDVLRDFMQEESFLIGLRLLVDVISPEAAGVAYAAVAEAVVNETLAHVRAVFAEKYGRVPGSRCVVLGLGKLGSREMSAASDLDIILIYDFDPARPNADGVQELDVVRYFTQLTQRLISALTVTTRRGNLYEVDLRLRPSGRKGPVATQFSSFASYQSSEAANWEHMALTRARVIAGDTSLGAEVEAMRAEILTRPPPEFLRRDVAEMHQLILQEKTARGLFDFKYSAGGLIDIDFIAQYLCLSYAHQDKRLLVNDPARLLAAAAEAGILAPEPANSLLEARRLYSDVTQLLQAFVGPESPEGPLNAVVGRRLAAIAGLPDIGRLESQIGDTRTKVKEIFEAVIGAVT